MMIFGLWEDVSWRSCVHHYASSLNHSARVNHVQTDLGPLKNLVSALAPDFRQWWNWWGDFGRHGLGKPVWLTSSPRGQLWWCVATTAKARCRRRKSQGCRRRRIPAPCYRRIGSSRLPRIDSRTSLGYDCRDSLYPDTKKLSVTSFYCNTANLF